MVITVVVAAVVALSVVDAVIVAVRRAISVSVFIKTHLCFLSVGVLVGGRDHLADPGRWLSVELRMEFAVMKSSDEGGDDFGFHDVGNRIPHLGKASEELRQLLVDAVEIMFGARSSTRSHIIFGEDFF